MDGDFNTSALLAALEWQVELGCGEAIGAEPVDRFAAVAAEREARAAQKARTAKAPPVPVRAPKVDPVALAKAAAGGARSLEELAAAQAGFEHCELRRGAQSFVFADGDPAARVMVIGEGPGAEEDREGKPFAGSRGRLFDRMFAAIGLDRASPEPGRGLYLTEVVPWRPPQDREPEAADMAMMRPFVERHIELAQPELIVLMGNAACRALLGRSGITRLRGQWHDVKGVPAMPCFHPRKLIERPERKREAWADLLALKARLEQADA